MGLMLASRQSSGHSPVSYDLVNICFKIGAHSAAVSLSTLLGSSSGPEALFGLRFLSNLQIPAVPKSMFAIGSIWEGVNGIELTSSVVNTEENWCARKVAFSLCDSAVCELCFRVGIVPVSELLLLIYCQNGRGFSTTLSTTPVR